MNPDSARVRHFRFFVGIVGSLLCSWMVWFSPSTDVALVFLWSAVLCIIGAIGSLRPPPENPRGPLRPA